VAVKGKTTEERTIEAINHYFNPPNFYGYIGMIAPSSLSASNCTYEESVRGECTVPTADTLVAESRSNSNPIACDDLKGFADFSIEYQTFPKNASFEQVPLASGCTVGDSTMMTNTMPDVTEASGYVLQPTSLGFDNRAETSGCVLKPSHLDFGDSSMTANTLPFTNIVQATIQNETQYPAQTHFQGLSDVSTVKMETDEELHAQRNQFNNVLKHIVFPRPVGAHAAATPNSTSNNVEVSIPCELDRGSDVPFLAGGTGFSSCAPSQSPEQTTRWCNNMQSSAINAQHIQDELNNNDGLDEELDDFLAEVWF
jgi:hypothetical protein